MSLQTEEAAENARHSALIPGLELLRGLASIEVFLSHLFLMFSFNNLPPSGRPFWMETYLTYGSEAVILFFALSGLVIAISQRQNTRDWTHFVRARMRRLAPLYLVAVLLGFIVERTLAHKFVPWPLWGHLLFLQTLTVPETPLFRANLPLWSLSYEFYFYLLFAITIAAPGRWIRPLIWIAGFAAMIPFSLGLKITSIPVHLLAILACMPVWMLGSTLLGKPAWFSPNLRLNLVLFSLTFVLARSFHTNPVFYSPFQCLMLALLIAPMLYSLVHPRQSAQPAGAASWLLVAILYFISATLLLQSAPVPYPYHAVDNFWLAVPPIAAALALLVPQGAAAGFFARLNWRPTALVLGRLSYAIYVVHMPVCAMIHHKMRNPWLRISLDLVLVALLAWICEYKIHPWLCDIFDRIWPPYRASHSAALRQSQTPTRA